MSALIKEMTLAKFQYYHVNLRYRKGFKEFRITVSHLCNQNCNHKSAHCCYIIDDLSSSNHLNLCCNSNWFSHRLCRRRYTCARFGSNQDLWQQVRYLGVSHTKHSINFSLTLAPLSKSAIQNFSPKPWPPPVTTAIFPSIFMAARKIMLCVQ